jgi:O-methyltransferase
MPKRSLLPARVEKFVVATTRESEVAGRLRKETSRLAEARMQIGPDQAAFFSLLVKAMAARRALEIGTFTGMSALAVATALPADGEAGVGARVDLRLGPAAATLQLLLAEKGEGFFDFAFIDADKSGYDAYYEACLRLVRAGGVIALDNMLWGGAVADPAKRDKETRILRNLNRKIQDDARLLTLGDGVVLVRKR